MSSVITISQPPSIPGDRRTTDVPTEMTFTPLESEIDPAELEMIEEYDTARVDSASQSDSEDGEHLLASESTSPAPSFEAIAHARSSSLAALQGENNLGVIVGEASNRQAKQHALDTRPPERKSMVRRRVMAGPDAVIVLKEERVS